MCSETPTIALVITGAVGSGKTTLAKRMGQTFGIPVHTEGPGKHYYEIEVEIDSSKSPAAIFEHCSILGAWRRLEQYDRVLIVALHVDEGLLEAHIDERLHQGVPGEFREIDALQQQRGILEDYQRIAELLDGDKFRCTVQYVERDTDYERVNSNVEGELRAMGIETEGQESAILK